MSRPCDAAQGRRIVLVLLFLLGGVHPAAAQGWQFLPRFDFLLSAEHISHASPRLVWDANFGAEVDVVDYGAGRFIFETNYQVILGEEFKNFDPNQGNYILAGVVSYRTHGVEIGGQFYHQSRHLADRFNRTVVDWNMFGVRVNGETAVNQLSISTQVDARRTIRKFFVDYAWELETQVVVSRPLASRFSLMGTGEVRVIGVDDMRNRDTLLGLRGEGGLRIRGDGGVLELFVAAERRIDPYPVESFIANWFSAGFRITR